ncbi:MAG: hypothetical protein ACTS3F_01655, partial [Phycisphaerales bacterium]
MDQPSIEEIRRELAATRQRLDDLDARLRTLESPAEPHAPHPAPPTPRTTTLSVLASPPSSTP